MPAPHESLLSRFGNHKFATSNHFLPKQCSTASLSPTHIGIGCGRLRRAAEAIRTHGRNGTTFPYGRDIYLVEESRIDLGLYVAVIWVMVLFSLSSNCFMLASNCVNTASLFATRSVSCATRLTVVPFSSVTLVGSAPMVFK